MPVNAADYPRGWASFSAWVRHTRAGERCECYGECGLHQPNPDPRRCVEINHRKARWFRNFVVLTVAHLCNCLPLCANPAHVKAMCQRCHLRVDAQWKADKRKARGWCPSPRNFRSRSAAPEIEPPM